MPGEDATPRLDDVREWHVRCPEEDATASLDDVREWHVRCPEEDAIASLDDVREWHVRCQGPGAEGHPRQLRDGLLYLQVDRAARA